MAKFRTVRLSFAEILGAVLRHHRKAQGVTQGALAEAADLTSSTWSRIESAQGAITVVQLRRAAPLLGMAAWEIVRDVEAVVESLEPLEAFTFSPEPPEEPDPLARSGARYVVTHYYELRSALGMKRKTRR